MSTHNICFRGEIRKVLCGYPLLSATMEYLPNIRSYLVWNYDKDPDQSENTA